MKGVSTPGKNVGTLLTDLVQLLLHVVNHGCGAEVTIHYIPIWWKCIPRENDFVIWRTAWQNRAVRLTILLFKKTLMFTWRGFGSKDVYFVVTTRQCEIRLEVLMIIIPFEWAPHGCNVCASVCCRFYSCILFVFISTLFRNINWCKFRLSIYFRSWTIQ